MYKKSYAKQIAVVLASVLLMGSEANAYVPEKTSNKYTPPAINAEDLNAIHEIAKNDKKITENEYLALYVDSKDLSIKVYDKVVNYYYSSNDLESESLNNYWMNYVNSPISIKTIDSKMQVNQETIFDSPKSSMTIKSKDKNGFTAEVYFGVSQITMLYSVTLDGKDIIFSMKDENSKEESTAAIVATEKAKKEEMEKGEDLSAKEKALLKKKNKTESYDLYSVQFYPFFGAVEAGKQDGYTFIPDGSGALIRYDKKHNNVTSPYDQPYLEEDTSINRRTKGSGYNTSYYQSLLLPVYGMIHGVEQTGFVSIAEKGYENARVLSYPAGLFTDFYFTTNEYRFNGVSQQQLSATQNITVKLNERLHYDINERIHFLAEEEANYTGQALYYKDYLEERDALNKVTIENNPLVIATAMGVVEKALFGNKVIPYTTTDEVIAMDQYFEENSISNVDYILKEATLDLYTGKFEDRSRVNKKLEGQKYSFEEMNEYLNENGSRAFVDAEIASGKGKISPDQYVIRLADKNYAMYKYTLGSKTIQMTNLNAMGILRINELNQKLLTDYGFAGINSDWGFFYTALTNNAKKGVETRQQMIEAQIEAMKNIAEQEKVMIGAFAPFYAFKDLDAARFTPMYTTQYAYITDTVPFYQIVLSGNIPMYTSPINEQTDLKEAFLKSVEYNVYPTFEVIDSTTEEMPPKYDLPSSKSWNQMFFYDWSAQISSFYTEIDSILSNVKNEKIVSHKVVGDSVVEIKYSNGKTIIVNYSNKDFQYQGIEVEKRGCAVI